MEAINILINKNAKIIYKLRSEGYTIREIKKIAKEKYKIYVTEKEVRSIAIKIKTGNNKYSDIDKMRILYLYHNYYDTHKLIEYLNRKYAYNITYNSIVDLAHKNGVKKKTQNMYSISFVDRSDEREIIELYKSGYSSNKIAELYGYKTRNSILQKLQKFNIKRRDCNEIKTKNKSYVNFSLEKIDCEEKAYFLGLLLTDGYVNLERGYIGIDLTDKDVIEFLSEYINIKYKEIQPTGKAKLTKYRITVYGREILEDAQRLGVVYGKTYTTKGPLLTEAESKFINYILRGIIDGDGWIRKDAGEFFICSASFDFIKWCEKSMIDIGFENIKISFISNEYNGIYIIRTASKYNLEVLKQNIYDKPFGMMRKYDRLYQKDVQRL
ncbi:hypothetical protein HMPREF1982_01008 [Clostridiales bacterium oral taxon 876 str. F0540]|nr:hypothetical protein HMPREF1982_01008 [Clostridiales bacterium oral taxon 876 str. F0540]